MNTISCFFNLRFDEKRVYFSHQFMVGFTSFNSPNISHVYNETVSQSSVVFTPQGEYLQTQTTNYPRHDKYSFSSGLNLTYKLSFGANIGPFSVYAGVDATYMENNINFYERQ